MKLLIYSLPLLTFALLGILLEEERAALVFLGSMCLVISLTVSLWNTTSLLKIVFAALAFHALFGLIVAEPSSEAIWIGGDPRQVYDTAFFIISLGLLAATFGFRFGRRRQVQLPVLNEERFRTITRRLALLAAVGMFAAYASLGALPWQIDILSIGSTRFVTGMTEWMIHRFMDVLTVTVAALFLYGKREKFYGIIGFFALLMPFRRATVMAVLLLAVLTWCVRRGRFKPLIVAMALAVSVYASSQILFLGLLRRDFDKREAYRAMGSALPEVRDLGWIIQLNHGHQWWGASYVQPLLPLPSFVIPWAQEHSLRTVSTALIGLDKESTGGLRLTLAGEAYLNFGFLGVLPICFLWGLGMRWIDSAAASVRTDSPFQSYAVSLLLSWLAFWIYLAGTQAGGIIKGGIIISAAVVYVCRNPRTARSVSPMASIPSATGPIQSEG